LKPSKLLLIIPLILIHKITIVLLINNIIIVFLTRAFSRNTVRKKKIGNNWSFYCFLFEKKTTNILSNITYVVFAQSPSAGTAMINIQSALRTTLNP